MSYKNYNDETAEKNGEEYKQQVQFREIAMLINKILGDNKIKPMKIALYNPLKMKCTVCNVQYSNIIIQIQYVKPKGLYMINSTINVTGEFRFDELMTHLTIARRYAYI